MARHQTPGTVRVEIEMDETLYTRMTALRKTLGRTMRQEIEAACDRHLSAPPTLPPPVPPVITPPLPPVGEKRKRGRPRKNG